MIRSALSFLNAAPPLINKRVLLCVAAFAGLGTISCAGAPPEASDVPASDAPDVGQAGQAVTVDPGSVYFVEVVANGSGCPATDPASTVVSISDDGLTLTATFSEYFVTIEAEEVYATKNCQLGIKMHSPPGVSVAVSKFFYQGHALLENGVRARQSAKYYWQGQPTPSIRDNTKNIVGPFDHDYLYQDHIATADLVWSPCGVQRDLNVATRLELRNASRPQNRGFGYIDTTAIDANVEQQFVWNFLWRPC